MLLKITAKQERKRQVILLLSQAFKSPVWSPPQSPSARCQPAKWPAPLQCGCPDTPTSFSCTRSSSTVLLIRDDTLLEEERVVAALRTESMRQWDDYWDHHGITLFQFWLCLSWLGYGLVLGLLDSGTRHLNFQMLILFFDLCNILNSESTHLCHTALSCLKDGINSDFSLE